jgi:hypothetical protein
MKAFVNHVIIRLDYKNDSVKIGDVKLDIDTRWGEAEHIQRWGVVTSAPKLLMCTKRMKFEWETTLEIQDGDIAYFDYLSTINAPSWNEGNSKFIILHYNCIYAYKRDDKIVPINGYLLCEQIKTKQEGLSEGLMPEFYYDKAIVKYAGACNLRYLHKGNKMYDDDSISVGDVILFQVAPMYLEYDLHKTLEPLVIVQRRYVIATIKDPSVVKFKKSF